MDENVDYKTKGLLASKTTWGCIVALLPLLHDLGIMFLTGVPIPNQSLISGIGALGALIGRVTANKSIKGLF